MRLVNIYIFKGIVSQNFKGSVSRDFFSYTFFLQNTLPRAVFVTCKKPTTKIVWDFNTGSYCRYSCGACPAPIY